VVKLALLFFSSGVGALVLQVVWQRRLSLLFGNTVHATGAVLAAFLGCLALGSALAGPYADRVRRPVRLFGFLEIAVGLGALASLALSPIIGQLGARAFRAYGGDSVELTAIRCLLAVLLIAPATVPMGGTLPAIAKMVARARHPGQALGLLYGINTLGAATGSILAAFVLVLALGFRATWLAAASIDIAIGLLVLVAGARLEIERDDPAPASAKGSSPGDGQSPSSSQAVPASGSSLRVGLYGLVFISGGVLLALEVLWTRALVLHLGSHVGTFALLLATVLVGLGAGGIIGGWLGDRVRDRLLVAGLAAVLAAVTGAWGVLQLRELGDLMVAVVAAIGVTGYWGTVFVQALAAAQVALLPSLLGGLVLPLVWREAHAVESQGRRVGLLTAASTVGTLFGSFGAAFLLVPRLGVGRSFAVVLCIELAIGVVVILSCKRFVAGLRGRSAWPDHGRGSPRR